MAFIGEGDWLAASALVIVGMIGFGMGGTFYDALLNDVASPAMRERVSAKGYAMGYLGGGVLLAINLALIIGWKAFGFKDSAGASQVSFAMVGVWWALFSLPLFKHVREAKGLPGGSAADSVREGLTRLGRPSAAFGATPSCSSLWSRTGFSSTASIRSSSWRPATAPTSAWIKTR